MSVTYSCLSHFTCTHVLYTLMTHDTNTHTHTQTICCFTYVQMKDDFQHLEDDMTHLGSRMEEITASSASINRALADRKREISKLCGVHHLLKKVRLSSPRTCKDEHD